MDIERIIDNAKKKKEIIEQKEAQLKKDLEELKDIANNLFSTPEGMKFARAIMKYCGLYNTKKSSDLYRIGIERGKEEIYLMFFKGLLNDDVISQIESKIEKGGLW